MSFDAPSFDDDHVDLLDHLHRLITDHLVRAAQRGWTPEDLRHAVGPEVDAFLPSAHALATAVAQPRISAAWHRQMVGAPALSPFEIPLGDVDTLAERLLTLPVFHDSEIYHDSHVLTRPENPWSALSAEQRRALQRIRGLLSKAESTTFEAEAETLIAKAQQLRQRYRIETVTPGSEEVPVTIVSTRVHLRAPWVRFQSLLLGAVAVPNSCRSVLEESVGIATLLGDPDDVRHCLELFASLNHQRDYFMRHSPGAEEAARRGETARYRRSFLHSYALRILDLLSAANSESPTDQESNASALPVLACRDKAVDAARDRVFPRLGTIAFGHRHHHGGAVDGASAAERSHLGPEATGLDSA